MDARVLVFFLLPFPKVLRLQSNLLNGRVLKARFPLVVRVGGLSRGNTGCLKLWWAGVLRPFFVCSFPVLQCIKMDGDSSGVFRWSGPGHHLVDKDKCILIDNVI